MSTKIIEEQTLVTVEHICPKLSRGYRMVTSDTHIPWLKNPCVYCGDRLPETVEQARTMAEAVSDA